VIVLFGQFYELAVARVDPKMRFNSRSNGHMLFLDGLRATQAPPMILPRISEGPAICLRFIAQAACAALSMAFGTWEDAILTNKAPVTP